MPREAEEGSTVELRCEWRLLGGAGLYSVKWYKDEHEFFRYVPDNDPKIQTFPQLGIHLDVSKFRIYLFYNLICTGYLNTNRISKTN